jgi:hypothetical protein
VEKASVVDEHGNTLKKPLSGFMLYCNHRRSAICQEHPGKSFSLPSNQLIKTVELSMVDISKLIG